MALVSFRSSIFNGTMMPTARVWPASSGILLVVRKIFHLNPSKIGTTSLHGSVKPGGIFSAVIALYFEHQDRLVEKALAAPAHSRLCAPTGGRSGSALCPLWEGAADIAGEGWNAAFDPTRTLVRDCDKPYRVMQFYS